MRLFPVLVFLLLVLGGGLYYLNRGLLSQDVPYKVVQNVIPKIEPVTVDTPKPNDLITSPLHITGKAISNWYFEATFPVVLLDANGEELGRVPAEAQSDWTSGGHISFEANLTFTFSKTSTGTLVFQKDNPSGLPKNDASFKMPVRFR